MMDFQGQWARERAKEKGCDGCVEYADCPYSHRIATVDGVTCNTLCKHVIRNWSIKHQCYICHQCGKALRNPPLNR